MKKILGKEVTVIIKDIEKVENLCEHRNHILIELKLGKESIGRAVLSEPIKNKFIKDGKGEIDLIELVVNPDYINEGIESLLFEEVANYIKRVNRLLMVCRNVETYTQSFFERRGLKFEPVIHGKTTYVLGTGYDYNLENIAEDMHEFLDKKEEGPQVSLDEIKMSYVEMIAEMNTRLVEAGEPPMVSFDFKGAEIYDPFANETAREEVNPVSYYGNAFTESAFWNPLDFVNDYNYGECDGCGNGFHDFEGTIEFDFEKAIDELLSGDGLLGLLESIFEER